MLIRGWGLSTTCRTGREAYGGSECQHVVTLLEIQYPDTMIRCRVPTLMCASGSGFHPFLTGGQLAASIAFNCVSTGATETAVAGE